MLILVSISWAVPRKQRSYQYHPRFHGNLEEWGVWVLTFSSSSQFRLFCLRPVQFRLCATQFVSLHTPSCSGVFAYFLSTLRACLFASSFMPANFLPLFPDAQTFFFCLYCDFCFSVCVIFGVHCLSRISTRDQRACWVKLPDEAWSMRRLQMDATRVPGVRTICHQCSFIIPSKLCQNLSTLNSCLYFIF